VILIIETPFVFLWRLHCVFDALIVHPKIGPDLPPKYLCRITWIYRKCGCFGLVRDFLMPLIRDSRNDFSTSEFARLSQAIPPEEVTPVMAEVQSTLRTQLSEMGRRELLYFMLGSIHLGNLEVEETPGSLLHECMQVVRDEQDNFKPEEVERMTIMLRTSEKYCHLLDLLPQSWYESVKFFLKSNDLE